MKYVEIVLTKQKSSDISNITYSCIAGNTICLDTCIGHLYISK